MKKNKITVGVLICMLFSCIIIVLSKNKTDEFQIIDDNVEALSRIEQPDINDCIPDREWVCVSLHPTDPDKDIEKPFYRWP